MTRLAYLTTSGAADRTYRMARLAHSSGYDVTIIEWDRTGMKRRRETENGLKYSRLSLKAPFGSSVLLMMPVWFFFAYIELSTHKFQVVQPRNMDSALPARFARFWSRRIIYDMADFYSDSYALRVPLIRKLLSCVEKTLVRGADALVLASPGQIDQICRTFMPTRMLVFYNVPMEERDFSNHPTAPQKEHPQLRFVYAGTLSPNRTRLLAKVAAALEGLPAELVLAGFGESEDDAARLAARNTKVKFLGRVPQRGVKELLNSCDVVVLPYDPSDSNDRIGMPNKLFDAMACGRPVLAPEGTHIGRLVREEGIGIVTDFGQVESMRDDITTAIGGKDSALKLMGERSKNLLLEKFNPAGIGERYVSMLDSVVTTERAVHD